METSKNSILKNLVKDNYWRILELFYRNRNSPLHLREISRRISLSEGPLTRHLNALVEEKTLVFQEEGNLKKFRISKDKIKYIFPLFDQEKLENLPLLRKNALAFYIGELEEKPVFVLLFGSTAKGTAKEESDIDILAVFNRKTNTKEAARYAEAQTGMKMSEFQTTYKAFKDEIKLKKDKVIQSALETGFPAYNHIFFYEALNDE